VLTANCYWFALATYVVLYAKYKDTATERRWAWCFYRFIPPTYITWWDMVTVPLVSAYLVPTCTWYRRKEKKKPLSLELTLQRDNPRCKLLLVSSSAMI